MLKMKIIARSGTYDAELDDSEISQAVWFSAHHFTAPANDLTGTLFFEMPVDVQSDAERQTVFDVGDIAWWPGVNALVLFYGPTPLSREGGRPVWKYKCIKIGRILGDCGSLEEHGDRQNIILEQEI